MGDCIDRTSVEDDYSIAESNVSSTSASVDSSSDEDCTEVALDNNPYSSALSGASDRLTREVEDYTEVALDDNPYTSTLSGASDRLTRKVEDCTEVALESNTSNNHTDANFVVDASHGLISGNLSSSTKSKDDIMDTNEDENRIEYGKDSATYPNIVKVFIHHEMTQDITLNSDDESEEYTHALIAKLHHIWSKLFYIKI